MAGRRRLRPGHGSWGKGGKGGLAEKAVNVERQVWLGAWQGRQWLIWLEGRLRIGRGVAGWDARRGGNDGGAVRRVVVLVLVVVVVVGGGGTEKGGKVESGWEAQQRRLWVGGRQRRRR